MLQFEIFLFSHFWFQQYWNVEFYELVACENALYMYHRTCVAYKCLMHTGKMLYGVKELNLRDKHNHVQLLKLVYYTQMNIDLNCSVLVRLYFLHFYHYMGLRIMSLQWHKLYMLYCLKKVSLDEVNLSSIVAHIQKTT